MGILSNARSIIKRFRLGPSGPASGVGAVGIASAKVLSNNTAMSALRAGMGSVPSVSRGVYKVVSYETPQLKQGKVVSMVTPLAPAGSSILSRAGGLLERAGAYVKSSFSPVGAAQKVKGALVSGGLAGLSAIGGEYVVRGKVDISPRAAVGFASASLNPIAFAMGIVKGGIHEGAEKVSAIMDKGARDDFYNKIFGGGGLGQSRASDFDIYSQKIKDLEKQFGGWVADQGGSINLNLPQMAGFGGVPGVTAAYSPSVQIGGGPSMGDYLPYLLLLMGGAGAAGYAIGRRKRKKKRYKKRKRR